MKLSLSILSLAPALALIVSCAGETEIPEPSRLSLEASLPVQTRTAMDGLDVFWSSGDRIGVFSEGPVYPFGLVSGAGQPSARFQAEEGPSEQALMAYYPYEGIRGTAGATLPVTLPAEQPYAGETFAEGIFPSAAVSTDGEHLVFSHLCAVLELDLQGSGYVRSVTVKARNGEALCGEGNVSFSGTPALALAGDDAVRLVCENPVQLSATAQPFLIVIPAGHFAQGFSITVEDIYGATVTKTASAPVTLEAGHLRTFASAVSLTAVSPEETVLYTWTCDGNLASTHAEFVHTYSGNTTSEKVYDDSGTAWFEYVCDGKTRTSQAYAISSGDYQFQCSPSFEDDAFLFSIPVTDFPADGGVLCLKGGLQAYSNGTPDLYEVEYLDDGEWKHSQTIVLTPVSGKSYSGRTEINAPARFTSAPASGVVQMRIRCATSTSRLNSSTDPPTVNGKIRIGGLTKADGAIQIVLQEKPAEVPADPDTDDYAERPYTTASFATHYQEYLSAAWPASVSSVTVEADKVTITGTVPDASGYLLADVRPMHNIAEATTFTGKTPITATSFSITVPRVLNLGSVPYDRVHSKWAVVKADGTLCSAARYADTVPEDGGGYSPAAAAPASKKGLGGLKANATYYSDLDDLGIGNVTMNITLNNLIATGGFKFSSNKEYTYKGVTYNINNAQIASYDARLKECAERGIIVAGILLMSKSFSDSDMGDILVNPESRTAGGHYALPDLGTAEGVLAYEAAVAYLAQRYDGHPINGVSRRIHHWIIFNEADFATEWLSTSGQSLERFMDYYIKSMRVTYDVVRQYDPNAWVMGSFTHCWTAADGQYAPKDMLDLLLEESRVEGDFPWGVAAHPYPQNLFLPRFWENDTSSTYSLDSPYITFKNPEVWDAWVKAPSHRYNAQVKRLLFFSENGTNVYNGNTVDQAAGAAWIWKKVSLLDGIDAIHWHNWMDNPTEGLNIGLRDADGNTRPSWEVWKSAGTASEPAVFDTYLETLGRTSWSDLVQEVAGQ